MGGRGSGGGRSSGGSVVKTQQLQNNSERIYKEKALNGSYINRKEFNEMREYLRENGSKEDILKLANHYGEIYNNRFDKRGDSATEFRSYELALQKLAREKKGR